MQKNTEKWENFKQLQRPVKTTTESSKATQRTQGFKRKGTGAVN